MFLILTLLSSLFWIYTFSFHLAAKDSTQKNSKKKEYIDLKAHPKEISTKNVLKSLAFLGQKCLVIDQNSTSLGQQSLDDIQLIHLTPSQFSDLRDLKSILTKAKKLGIKVSCDLASVDLVCLYKKELLAFLPIYVDIVFANEKEMKELTQLPPIEACDYLSSFCEVVAVTMGYSGSWVKSGDLQFYTPSFKQNQILNAGVGDLYVSGFLYGYLNNYSIPFCSWIGSFVASKAIGNKVESFDLVFWKDVALFLKKELEEVKSK